MKKEEQNQDVCFICGAYYETYHDSKLNKRICVDCAKKEGSGAQLEEKTEKE